MIVSGLPESRRYDLNGNVPNPAAEHLGRLTETALALRLVLLIGGLGNPLGEVMNELLRGRRRAEESASPLGDASR